MTDSYSRPSPDALLAQLRQTACGDDAGQSSQPARGLLKIFFGYAAGVGKTYSMLRSAHAALEMGHDIVAGYVEPHPRPETAALLPGLDVVAPLRQSHRGITLSELNVDAVLARKPQIALVDELAHTNAEGCRNRKRYQDVEELLQAGISVWTTVNVQHIESLNDVVAALTGVVVRERIPDSVFDGADQVELVDLEPDELMARLREGKIYGEAQVQRALGHFFLPANLIALREIALRRMADRVNRRAASSARDAASPTRQIKEHILICLSGAPSNARVIRTAARMVEAFRADFTALFVQNTNQRRNDAKSSTLRDNLKLAEDLGAVIVTLQGEDIPVQIAEYARMSGVSKIVVGRSPASGWLFHRGKTLVERLAELAPEMETFIIPDAAPVGSTPSHHGPLLALLRTLLGTAPRSWRQWGATGALMAVCSVIGLLMFSAGMPNGGIAGLYMLGVLGVSILTAGPWYGVTASVAGVALFDFLFVEPRFSFTVYDMDYVGLFTAMLLVSTATSAITGRARTQARNSAVRALHTELLLGNSRRLQKAKDEPAILLEAARQLGNAAGVHGNALPGAAWPPANTASLCLRGRPYAGCPPRQTAKPVRRASCPSNNPAVWHRARTRSTPPCPGTSWAWRSGSPKTTVLRARVQTPCRARSTALYPSATEPRCWPWPGWLCRRGARPRWPTPTAKTWCWRWLANARWRWKKNALPRPTRSLPCARSRKSYARTCCDLFRTICARRLRAFAAMPQSLPGTEGRARPSAMRRLPHPLKKKPTTSWAWWKTCWPLHALSSKGLPCVLSRSLSKTSSARPCTSPADAPRVTTCTPNCPKPCLWPVWMRNLSCRCSSTCWTML